MRKIGTGKRDVLKGGAGADRLDGRGDVDQLDGLGGNDRLYGGAGIDVLQGGDGNDRLYGGTEGDLLLGDAGNDRLYGGDDADLLMGGAGRDKHWGGEGLDFFVFDRPGPADSIMDYEAGETLVLVDFVQGGDFDGVRGSRLEIAAAGRWQVLEFDGKAIVRIRGDDLSLDDVEIARTPRELMAYADEIL